MKRTVKVTLYKQYEVEQELDIPEGVGDDFRQSIYEQVIEELIDIVDNEDYIVGEESDCKIFDENMSTIPCLKGGNYLK